MLGRIKMIALAVAGSAFIALGGLVWWLHENNQDLVADRQRLKQANADLAESARNQKAVADTLQADIIKRDELAQRAMQARNDADKKLQKARQALHDALQDNECAGTAHPAAVGDWLRKNSDSL
jgi:hypothetical protein